jgi:hypothetical protein
MVDEFGFDMGTMMLLVLLRLMMTTMIKCRRWSQPLFMNRFQKSLTRIRPKAECDNDNGANNNNTNNNTEKGLCRNPLRRPHRYSFSVTVNKKFAHTE